MLASAFESAATCCSHLAEPGAGTDCPTETATSFAAGGVYRLPAAAAALWQALVLSLDTMISSLFLYSFI